MELMKMLVVGMMTTDLEWNLNELAESFLHPVLVSGGVVAQDQVQTRFEVALIIMRMKRNDLKVVSRGWNDKLDEPART